MKKRIARYFGLKLMDLAEFVMAQKPNGVNYTAEDKEIMKRIKKVRDSFREVKKA